MRRTTVAAVLFLGQLIFPLTGRAAKNDDQWNSLGRITWHRSYTFLLCGGIGVSGEITALTDRSVTIRSSSGQEGAKLTYTSKSFDRAHVLRVTDGPEVHDVVYSALSSWYDVQEMSPLQTEGLRIVTKNGKTIEGSLSQVSSSEISITRLGKKRTFVKDDVALVYYLRIKPLTSKGIYAAQEAPPSRPDLWPHMLHVVPRLCVLLYNAGLPPTDPSAPCGDP